MIKIIINNLIALWYLSHVFSCFDLLSPLQGRILPLTDALSPGLTEILALILFWKMADWGSLQPTSIGSRCCYSCCCLSPLDGPHLEGSVCSFFHLYPQYHPISLRWKDLLLSLSSTSYADRCDLSIIYLYPTHIYWVPTRMVAVAVQGSARIQFIRMKDYSYIFFSINWLDGDGIKWDGEDWERKKSERWSFLLYSDKETKNDREKYETGWFRCSTFVSQRSEI